VLNYSNNYKLSGIKIEMSHLDKYKKHGLGFTQVFWGNGKGKSTSSFGTALRAVGNGYNVHLVQFMKNGADSLEQQIPGEIQALEKFPEFSYRRFGSDGWVIKKPTENQIKACQTALNHVKESLNKYQIVIADEILYAVQLGLLKEKEIIETNDNLSPMNSKLDFNKTGNNESADYIKKTTVGNTYNYNTTHNRMNNNSNINDDRKKNLDTSVPRHMNIEDSNLNNTNIRKKYKGNTQHSFEVTIEKLINIPILKTIDRPFIKLKFFSDYEYVKSDTLVYSNIENSIIDVDMKSTHSIFLNSSEKIGMS